LVAIFDLVATNILMGCDIWILWPPKMGVALVESFVARGWC
jgi:hypothetical protein